MAVTGQPEPPLVTRPVTVWHFVRLKLRVMANGFRGQHWRITLFVLGVLGGLWFAASGFLLLALPGLVDNRQLAVVTAAFGGGLLVLGWVFLPLVLFGVDETLDPSRFALLPLRRRTLLTGLLTAALVGVPALATLLATSGLAVTAWHFGGPLAGLVALVGAVAGLLLCVLASRAVTSTFAAMLRSRRMRDLAAILLAVCAALLGPLQLVIAGAAEQVDWDGLTGPAQIIGWTPLAAPYTMGLDVADGRLWAVPGPPCSPGGGGRWSRRCSAWPAGAADPIGPPPERGTGGHSRRPTSCCPDRSAGSCPATGTAHWSPGRSVTGGGTPGAGPD